MIRASIAVLLSCEAAFAAAALVPTIDQSLNMKTVSDAQISPDGRYVAYLLEAPNWDDNEIRPADLDYRDGYGRTLSAHQR